MSRRRVQIAMEAVESFVLACFVPAGSCHHSLQYELYEGVAHVVRLRKNVFSG